MAASVVVDSDRLEALSVTARAKPSAPSIVSARPSVVGSRSEGSPSLAFSHSSLDRFDSAGVIDLPAAQAARVSPSSAKSKAGSSVVFISPFRVTLYARQGADFVSRSGQLFKPAEVPLTVGRYVFTLDAEKLGATALVDSAEDIPFKVLGKRQVIEKVSYDRASGRIRIQIRVVENIVWMLALLAAAGAALGFAGWGIGHAVNSVDTVLVDVSSAWWQWGLIIVAVVVGWWFLQKRPAVLGG